ncbi:MAG: ABC-F family ATP-binding cassette domain-containing protein [Bacteroidales bacterium]|nr:ABC-F family ATP-binding cassette domain-containing protein [Bacteroidales bacterium]MDD3667554.1 ABC-F family ATP-binding cassette domain-containing protein [Bacteroidales bacterium]MEA4967562.1 ABC-F family ATP-binding cassette domain-containing protein [Bacteroidaceae bacterium]MEA5099497.1 ABC-F family ATP-binding cassette domain-containing protein [Bacteroidales bacterium]NCC18521.1 ABC-F family ATP-binding cassette domain-containing protein [Bacteroidia bacterium]
MISIEQITVEFDSRRLLDNITFLVNQKDKIGLVGRNGAGKSTLLKLIAGHEQATSGKIVFSPDLTVGYLPQHMIHNEGTTVMQETQKAFDRINQLQLEIDSLTKEMSEREDYESDEYSEIIDKLSRAYEHMQIIDSGNFQAEMEKTLLGLGFLRSDFDRQCSEFSGGWRMRVELAKILLQCPDVILLDEPTNHLDIESIQWLENFLAYTSSAILLVSHDKIFIDSVTNRTIEISLGQIHDYKVNYSKYLELRQERKEQQLHAYENQQKIIQDNQAFINRFRCTASKAALVQSRIKLLEKLERVEIDIEDTSSLRLKFPPAPRSGPLHLDIDNLTKKYGDKIVLDNIGMVINRGEKVAFVGKNGEGKSTLAKCILQEIEYSGKLELGYNVKIGYFAQNQPSLLDESLSVFQTVDNVAVGDIRTRLREILGSFMFGGEAIEKKVKVLSGGERSRLAMVRLLLEPANLLILDEPTNHLDIPSKEVLKEAIKAFDGTAIIVSHDREFLDGLVDKVFEFGNKKVREHIGGIYDFLQKKKIENLNELGV